MMKKLLIAASVASALGMAPAISSAAWGVSIDIAPPAPRVVAVPAPRPGYIWAPGYWDWRENRHVWVDGRWIAERPGYVYAQPGWVQHDGHWVLERGHWHPMGDHDHDGVPNAVDTHPNNPYRP
jgi:hypothetical protein